MGHIPKPSSSRRQRHLKGALLAGLLLSVLVTVTWLFERYGWDLKWTAPFYDPEHGWKLLQTEPWLTLYKVGTVPGILFTLAMVVVWFVSHLRTRWLVWRRPAMLLLLTSVIGGGILVNGILKDYWGRPRPRQVIEFDGRWQFLNISQPGVPGKGKSFPCGHCTMGYLFASSIFLFPQAPVLAVTGGVVGLTYGVMISISRVGQGGHFPSDAMWSFGIVMLTAIVLNYFVLKPQDAFLSNKAPPWSRRKKALVGLGTALVMVVMVVAFLTRRPFFEDNRHGLDFRDDLTRFVVEINVAPEKVHFHFQEGMHGRIQSLTQGFAWPDSDIDTLIQREHVGKEYHLKYQLVPYGFFSERNIIVHIHMPESLRHTIDLQAREEECDTIEIWCELQRK